MSKESKTTGGLSLSGALLLIFVTLKLLGVAPVAAWSWLWVLAPLWISILFTIALVIFYLFIVYILTKNL